MTRTSGINPDQMSPEARLAELGRILATGIQRLREQSSPISADRGDSSLAIPVSKSVSRPGRKARKGGR
jgi:hypothetical protein